MQWFGDQNLTFTTYIRLQATRQRVRERNTSILLSALSANVTVTPHFKYSVLHKQRINELSNTYSAEIHIMTLGLRKESNRLH